MPVCRPSNVAWCVGAGVCGGRPAAPAHEHSAPAVSGGQLHMHRYFSPPRPPPSFPCLQPRSMPCHNSDCSKSQSASSCRSCVWEITCYSAQHIVLSVELAMGRLLPLHGCNASQPVALFFPGCGYSVSSCGRGMQRVSRFFGSLLLLRSCWCVGSPLGLFLALRGVDPSKGRALGTTPRGSAPPPFPHHHP